MSEKPVIFISHSSKDTELARLIKQQIEICIDGAEAFASDIEPGENWFEKVMGKLKEADAIVVLITPNSVAFSHWVWFEMGYFWSRHDNALESPGERGRICYLLYLPDIELPNPVSDLQIQMTSLLSKRDLNEFFLNLEKRFDGKSISVNYDEIIAASQKISKIPLQNTMIHKEKGSKLYHSHENYGENDLREVVNDIVKRAQRTEIQSNPLFTDGLIRFNQFDIDHNLPNGTAKKFLTQAMEKLEYSPAYQSEYVVRFQFDGIIMI